MNNQEEPLSWGIPILVGRERQKYTKQLAYQIMLSTMEKSRGKRGREENDGELQF